MSFSSVISHWLPNWRERLKASAIHFGSSILILGLVAWLTLHFCYPAPYSKITGGYKLLGLLASVDAILGPLLTFCVFNRAKKSLKMDLAVIVALQIAAMSYGVWAAVQGRPVYQVHMVDRFEILTANEVELKELQLAPKGMQELGFGAPKLAYWIPPRSIEERSQLTLVGMSGAVGLRQLMSRYQNYDATVASAILERAISLDKLAAMNTKTAVDEQLRLHGLNAAQVLALPLDGRMGSLTVFLDKTTAKPLATVPLDPWGQ